MADSQEIVNVPDSGSTVHDKHEDWYAHGCASLDIRTGGLQSSHLGRMRVALTSIDRCWEPGETLSVGFRVFRTPGTPIQQGKVRTVIQEWAKYVNLTFEFVDDERAMIPVSFDSSQGSWSYIGQDNRTVHPSNSTMNFSWVSDTAEISERERGVILYEFGHCIGYLHELQSSRRKEKLTLDEKAVIEFYTRTQGWTEEKVRAQIINVFSDSLVSSFTSVDLTSVMMYYMPAEINLERIDIPPNNKLSDFDKAHGIISYPYFSQSPNKHLQDPAWTFSRALDFVGITGDTRALMEGAYEKADFQRIRAEYALFSLNQRALAAANETKVG